MAIKLQAAARLAATKVTADAAQAGRLLEALKKVFGEPKIDKMSEDGYYEAVEWRKDRLFLIRNPQHPNQLLALQFDGKVEGNGSNAASCLKDFMRALGQCVEEYRTDGDTRKLKLYEAMAQKLSKVKLK